jgi:ribonuclease E
MEAKGEADAADIPLAEAHFEGVPEHLEPAAETDEEARARRRGRRGGRRRRRDEPEQVVPIDAEQPDLPPVYTGPTPANPFGGHAFDIFDVLEQAEANATPIHAHRLPAAEPPALTPGGMDETPAPPAVPPSPETPAALEILNSSAPEPVPEETAGITPGQAAPDEAPAELPGPAPEGPIVANDVVAEPAIRPIVIGAPDEPPVEKKRGWWRR